MTDKPKRSCGTSGEPACTACCTIMGVSELKKPAHVSCRHIGQGCCTIYAERPPSCASFMCAWLASDPGGLIDDSMRPDRIGIVFTITRQGLMAHVDPTRPYAWRAAKPLALLRRAAANGMFAAVTLGRVFWVVGTRGQWEVPREDVTLMTDGTTDVRVPAAIAREIGFCGRN
jgi:hypothetical protein